MSPSEFHEIPFEVALVVGVAMALAPDLDQRGRLRGLDGELVVVPACMAILITTCCLDHSFQYG